MFHKTLLGIQRDNNDQIQVRIEGKPSDLLVLLSTLNAEVYKKVIANPAEYNTVSTMVQEGTLRSYLTSLAEDKKGNNPNNK